MSTLSSVYLLCIHLGLNISTYKYTLFHLTITPFTSMEASTWLQA